MTVLLPALLRSLTPEVAEKANLGYITIMNKSQRVATLKHRRKIEKLKERRRAELKAKK